VLLAGDGALPRHPHQEVQGQAADHLDMAEAMNAELLRCAMPGAG
jgi:hypothetical protein